MSRHRNVRAMNIDEEYDGYYDSAYGHSVEEEFCISPRTEAQFLYNRDAQKHSMSAFLDASPDSHVDEYSGNEDGSRVRCDSLNERPNLSGTDRAKLESCVEAMQNVVGDTISESILIKAATANCFDLEKALDAVLSSPGVYEKPKPPRSQNVTGTKKEFCIHRKCVSPDNIGGASKKNHYKCNIISNGCLGHPSIYDPLILHLLKMFITFIEFSPILEEQYCCELNSGNGFSTHLSSFYSLLVPFFTKFCSPNIFTLKYRKIRKKLHLLNADLKNEVRTQELIHNENVVSQKFTTELFHCIRKSWRFVLKLLHRNSAVTESSLFSNEELSHFTQILQIFQSHLPVTRLHPSACFPSSLGLQQHCKNNSFTDVAVPDRCMPAKEKFDNLADEKSGSFNKIFILHTNQQVFVTRLSLPKTDYARKTVCHMICKKENICDYGNINTDVYSYYLLCLLKSDILKSAADVNILQRLKFSTGKFDNSYNCKYQLQPFYKPMVDPKNGCHLLLNFLNSVHENESICINYVLLPDGPCFEMDITKLRNFKPNCFKKKQLLVRNPLLSFSKDSMDVLTEFSVLLPQRHFETKHHRSLQYEKAISNGKFAFCGFDSTGKFFMWGCGVVGAYPEPTKSAVCKLKHKKNSTSALKVLFECAGSLHHVTGYYNSLQLFLSSKENPLLRFRNHVDSGAVYSINCCKSIGILESPDEVNLFCHKQSELSLPQDHLHICRQPVNFSSFMKRNVSSAFQNCFSSYTSDTLHDFLDHIASYCLLVVEENLNMHTEMIFVDSECVKANHVLFLKCTLQVEKGPLRDHSIVLSGSHECNINDILHTCFVDSRCSVVPKCDNTHAVNKALTDSNSCQKLLLLCLIGDHIYYACHVGGNVHCPKWDMETGTDKAVLPARNLNQVQSKLSLPGVKYSEFNLPVVDHVKFEDLITTASVDAKCSIGSCTSLNGDLAELPVLENLRNETARSSDNCSDSESFDDLSLDDSFLSLNSGIADLLSNTESYSKASFSIEHVIDTGQDCGVEKKLLHTKTDSASEIANDLCLSGLYLSTESSEVEDNSTLSFEDEPQEYLLSDVPDLKDLSSAEAFGFVTTVDTSLDVVHSNNDFNCESVIINDRCRGSENVQLQIQSSVLSKSCHAKHNEESLELDAYCCAATDSSNCDPDIQRRFTAEDEQLQNSDNFFSSHNISVASEVISKNCNSEQQSLPHSLFDCGFGHQSEILNEQLIPECTQFSYVRNKEHEFINDICDEQNDLLNKSLSDIYFHLGEDSKNSDFLCTSSELPSLSSVDNSKNTERSNVCTECSLVVQNEISSISSLNLYENNESQGLSESNVEVCDKVPCSVSDLINCENSCDILKNSDFVVCDERTETSENALQNETSDWSYSDIFHSTQNCASAVSENMSCNDLSFLNSFNDADELSQVVNCGTEQTSFPNIELSDLYLSNRCVSPLPNRTSNNASHLFCTSFSSVHDGRIETSENPLESEDCNSPILHQSCTSTSPILCAGLGFTAESSVCETVEPIENITLSDLCFEIQTKLECPSKCVDGNDLNEGLLLERFPVVKPEKETKQNCNTTYAKVPNVSLSELYNTVKPIGQEDQCMYAKSSGLLSPSFGDSCFNLEPDDASKSAEKSKKVGSHLDLHINSETDKCFDISGGASGMEFTRDHHNSEFTITGDVDESKNDYFRMTVTADISGQNHEIDEVDSKHSISEDGSFEEVSGHFDDDISLHVITIGINTPVQTTLTSPEFFQETLQPVGPYVQLISEPVGQDHMDVHDLDLSVVERCPNSYPADLFVSDLSLTDKTSSTSCSCLKSKLSVFSENQETEFDVKPKKSLFSSVLKCKSKPAKSHTFPKPPQTLHEMLESIGYAKYFQFSTPSPDDVIKMKQKNIIVSPGSSSTIKPPRLETVEDEKEFAFTSEISGRMIISNGDIKTPDDFESAKNTPAVPEGERDCEKAVEKSDVLQASVDEGKGKNDEQGPTSSAEQLSNLKIDANDKEVLVAYKKERGGSKPLINLVVIGHVDAGKSTLMGHLLYRLGCVAKKMMHKYEQDSKKLGKSSFMYAWVLDETSEERNRGITMDVAQSKFETPHRSVTLLDAPGHKDFIPNMITGAAQADVAVLVLDSTRGEFETGFEAGGQTREHTMLIRSLGVSQLAVAVNKLDNVNWDQERYKEIVSKLSAFLKQAGFKESEVQFVPCSGLTGENLIKPPETPELKKWYSGPCLVDVIDSFKPPERPVSKPFRFCISDVFKGMGSGFCVSGRIEAGYVQNGDKVLVMPAAEQATVKGITIDETNVQHSFAGDHATLQLSGVDMNNVTTGCVVCDIAKPVKVSARFQARLVIFNITVPITKGFPVILHYQSMSEQAFVKKLISQLHRSTGQVVKKKPRCLSKNSSAVVEIEVIRPVCLEVYKDFKELGRFMLRSGGSTIAAGLVTEIL